TRNEVLDLLHVWVAMNLMARPRWEVRDPKYRLRRSDAVFCHKPPYVHVDPAPFRDTGVSADCVHRDLVRMLINRHRVLPHLCEHCQLTLYVRKEHCGNEEKSATVVRHFSGRGLRQETQRKEEHGVRVASDSSRSRRTAPILS